MKSKLLQILASSLLGLASAWPTVCAQDEDGPQFTTREIEALSKLPKIPERQQREPGDLAFAIFSYGKNGEDYFYLRKEKPERIIFNTGVVRRFQFGGEEGRLVIYKRLVNEEGEQKLVPVAQLTPPSGSRDGIVLFRPREDDGTKGTRNLRYVDMSKKSFQKNDVRMINMTTQPLVAQLNDKAVKLPPMEEVVRRQRAGSRVFPVKVGMTSNKKLKVLYSNFLQVEPENRVMLMIVPDWTNSSAGSPVRCMVYKDSGVVKG